MNRCTVINKNLFLTSAWLMCTIGIIFPGLLYSSISMKLFVQFVKRGFRRKAVASREWGSSEGILPLKMFLSLQETFEFFEVGYLSAWGSSASPSRPPS